MATIKDSEDFGIWEMAGELVNLIYSDFKCIILLRINK